jgi:hypothetical protein
MCAFEYSARLAQTFEQAPSFIAVLEGPMHRIGLANLAYRKLVGERDAGWPAQAALRRFHLSTAAKPFAMDALAERVGKIMLRT